MTTYISSKNVVVGEKDGYVEFVVSLSAAATEQVSVRYGTSGLSADSGSYYDFIGDSGTLVFAPGTTSQTVRIAINDDKLVERMESFALTLSSATNAVIATSSAMATIVDNDTLADSAHRAGISVRDIVVDASSGKATFAVVLDKAVGSAFSVAYNTVDGTALAGTAYVGASGSLTFAAGETAKNVTVTLPKVDAATPAQLFSLALGAVTGAGAGEVAVADGIGQALIGAHGQTPKAMPAISVNSPFVGEKDGYVEFIVSLDAPSQQEVSVHYGTTGMSADSGYSYDFMSTNGTLVFAPGTTIQTVRIAINDDLTVERLESFALSLNSPINAVIAKPAGLATIVDNDTLADSANHAALSVRDVVVDASADTLTFAVVLDKATSDSFSVAYSTANGSALAGSDYVAANGTLTFGAGETVKNITIALPHGSGAEPVETFNLVLGAVSGNAAGTVDVADGIGMATIGAHGQTAKSLPTISVSNTFVGEKDGYAEFIVSLDAPSQQDVRVYYGVNGQSADSGYSYDFLSSNGNLLFAAGTTTQTVRVVINDDLNVESLESFRLVLSSPSNAVIANGNGSGLATIVDNDTMADSANRAGISVRDVIVDASADTATFAVVLDKATTGNFNVSYSTVDGSATAGSDYIAASGTLSFGAGETVKTVTVALPHDGVAEGAEMFNLVLGTISGDAAGAVGIARGAGHATIGAHGQTAVAMPLISVGDLTVGENNGYADFVVSLNAPSSSMVSVYYTTSSGTADSGYSYDFLGTSGTLNFAPGVTTQVVRVVINSDNLTEALETFQLRLSSATNATIAKAAGSATIVDASTWQVVTGGAGLDTVAYGGARADYTVTRVDGGFTVSAKDGSGGTDQLAGVERIHFADTNVALDVDGSGIGGQAYRIYQAAFNRAPDAGGLGFWMSAMDRGTSLNDVAAGFMQSDEFIGTYGAAPSNLDLVSKIYMNVLHRPAEAAGLNYWVNALDQHAVTAAQALGLISESAENQGAVATVIGNGFAYTPFG